MNLWLPLTTDDAHAQLRAESSQESSYAGKVARSGRNRSAHRQAAPAHPSNRLRGWSGTREPLRNSSLFMNLANSQALCSQMARPVVLCNRRNAYAPPLIPWHNPGPFFSRPRSHTAPPLR